MAHTFLIFDFGVDEEMAQKARRRIDGWKQAFKLDRKLLARFEREAAEAAAANAGNTAAAAKPKSKDAGEAGAKSKSENGLVRLLVRLDFSEHEKLSHQRWLQRLPSEEIFKAAKPEIVATGDEKFDATAKRFEALEAQPGPPHAR